MLPQHVSSFVYRIIIHRQKVLTYCSLENRTQDSVLPQLFWFINESRVDQCDNTSYFVIKQCGQKNVALVRHPVVKSMVEVLFYGDVLEDKMTSICFIEGK